MEAKEKIAVRLSEESVLNIDGVQVSFVMNEQNGCNFIQNVEFSIGNISIDQSCANKAVLADFLIPSEIKSKIYLIANYIANRLRIEIRLVDIVDPSFMLCQTPIIEAETEQEEALLNSIRLVDNGVMFGKAIPGQPVLIDLKTYSEDFCRSMVFVYFADGLRATNPGIKYELFYRVIECFFEKDKVLSTQEVASYCEKIDSRFGFETIKELRAIRNQLTHPHAELVHLSTDNLLDLAKIQTKIPLIKDLAKLLINNPPS